MVNLAATLDQINQVRALIADLDENNKVLTDAQISAYVDLNSTSVRLAAADALDAIATSEVLISKVIKTQDLATDGAKVADALHKLAESLRKRARELGEDPAADAWDGFDVVDTLPGYGTWPEATTYVTGL